MSIRTIIATETLAQHLDDPKWAVFDCRHSLADFSAGRRSYESAHISGAFFADVEGELAGVKTGANGRHPLPEPQAFASFLRDCGVSETTQLVAYDAGADVFAARFWLLARWIGHDAVAVLDGGLKAWLDEKRPLSAQLPRRNERGDLRVALHPELIVDASFVETQVDCAGLCIVDARSSDRYAGENETIDPVAGHIPGARNRPYKEIYADDSRFKNADALRQHFGTLGDPGTVIHQCGSGISAAANMLAMEIAGLRGSRIYAGSWSEWIANPQRPVAIGPR
ncbi:MAG: sulfurtransferase [Candidatus Eremiobacteraeota bacterium]|nr:sulfurtransferase [Candidatus Eremiobacteraeota bacterium]